MLTAIRERLASGPALLSAVVVGAALLCAAPAAADNARWGAGYFPNVTLTTQDGERVKFYDDLVRGRIVAINLIYTTCKYACPLETARLTQVAKLLGERMGRDIFFYSITIDPDHDTPAVLKAYAEKYQVGPGWTFLTGKKDDIELISKKLGLYSSPDPSNPDGHMPMLLVGNEETGQWMRNSATDNPKFLSRTIGDWLNSWQTAKKVTKSYAEMPAFTFDRGEYMFRTHCAACHTIGKGEHFGPDLVGVTSIHDRDWLARFILSPEAVRAAGDQRALALRAKYQQVVMPSLDLNKADVAALIDYLEKKSDHAGAAAETPAPSPSAVPETRVAAGGGNLSAMVNAYVRVQRALNLDQVGDANDARAIAGEATKLGATAAAIESSANELAKASSLAAARAAFAGVGDAIMAYAKDTGAAFDGDVRVAYCPMANKRWLQKGETAQNPFYGKAMSDCGRIVSGVASEQK